jgi:hypothetical protein
MAPPVGPLGACILRDKRHRVRVASGKVAAGPRLVGKQSEALWIAFAGGEGIAKADHQTSRGVTVTLAMRPATSG